MSARYPGSCGAIALLICLTMLARRANAAIIPFDLKGNAGVGLLGGNVFPTPVVNGGSGAENGIGVVFDDLANVLTVNVWWGSAHGLTDLSGIATAGHLHGPTATGGTSAYSETASIRYTLNTLAGWNSNKSSGGFSNAFSILPAEVPALLDGQFYIVIHTAANPAGEMRGNLVSTIPEPMLSGGLVLFWLVLRPRSARIQLSMPRC